MGATARAMITARALCAEHGIDERHAPAISTLIILACAETEQVCAEKAMLAMERAFDDGVKFARSA